MGIRAKTGGAGRLVWWLLHFLGASCGTVGGNMMHDLFATLRVDGVVAIK